MIRRRHTIFFSLLCLTTVSLSQGQEAGLVPKKKIDLLSKNTFSKLAFHISKDRSLARERDEVWKLNANGILHVTGKGWGYLRTPEKYRDYHLVLEYQWAERIYGHRGDKARDGGIMVHGYGKDGAFGGMFLSSFQAQLLEGGSGDLIALAARDENGKPAPTTMQAKVRLDRDGEPVWDAGGEPRSFPKPNQIAGRLNWKDRDPDWQDLRGFRGAKDIENPPGEWNRLEVICRGEVIQIRINGELVNEASAASPGEGWVCLQSEAAEMRIRRWELWPLDQFKEAWKEEFRSTDTGYRTDGESILPRRFALSPSQSLEAWQIDEGYEIQLVAAEPLVCDPVDVVWDENGQMFVAEMGDYPLPTEEEGDFLSRIRLLSDKDGDGQMDSATTWASNLDHVQGMLPYDGGLVATTRTAILFLKDTDGDGVADVRKKLFEQNAPRHNQLQVSSPRWGLDNAIYFNNGLDLKEIYPADAPQNKITAASRNLRFDPWQNKLKVVSGRGQFGASLDNWNRRYFSTNRNPIIFSVFPLEAAKRNPFAAITQVQEDLEEPGAKLRPLKLSHTTSVAHAGTYTAACGICVYRGGLMPELTGQVFVCDPTAQVVTRCRLRPQAEGASFSAERQGEGREFLASNDDWARPVNLRNGPDGALYVCDMYRRYIDHARFFPEEFSKTNYMRAGFDQGRIWRIVPRDHQSTPPTSLPEKTSELAAELESEHSWRRLRAHRLLLERGETGGAEEILKSSKFPEARTHALWLLAGRGKLSGDLLQRALTDPHDGVVENALQLVESPRDHLDQLKEIASKGRGRATFWAMLKLAELPGPDVDETFARILFDTPARTDRWMRKAILSGSKDCAGKILAELVSRRKSDREVVTGNWDEPSFAATIREFAEAVAAKGDLDEWKSVLTELGNNSDREFEAWEFAFAEGFSSGLRRSTQKQKSLSALIAKPPKPVEGLTEPLAAIVEASVQTVLDRGNDEADRLAALPLAAQKGESAMFEIAEKLIAQSESSTIQAAACRALARFNRKTVAKFFFERWNDLPPTPRGEALNLVASNPNTAIELMKKMKAGEIPKSIMPPMQRWSYGRSSNKELKALAKELFGKTDDDRARVVADYRKGIANLDGDPVRGKAVFQKAACVTCHKKEELGVDVGPPLADVRIKPDEALLTDILDPNRAVEERWALYQIETKSGQTYAGLIASESDAAIEITMPGGQSETIARKDVAKTTSPGLSLMPVGLEATVSKQEMADLLAFLRKQ